jgi:hypothetical protein
MLSRQVVAQGFDDDFDSINRFGDPDVYRA